MLHDQQQVEVAVRQVQPRRQAAVAEIVAVIDAPVALAQGLQPLPVVAALRDHKRQLLALPRVALCGRAYPVVVDAVGAAFVLTPPTLREVVEYEGRRRGYPAVDPLTGGEGSWRAFAASGDDAALLRVLDALPGGVV